MPRLYRQPKTKPIPPGSRIVEAKGGVKLAKWTDAKGKERTALLTLDGESIRVLSTKWYGEYRDADGRKIREPLSPNKDAAQFMLNEKVREAEMGKAGVRDRFAAHRKRPLAEHLKDFEAVLRAKGDTEKQVVQKVNRVRSVLGGCGFVFIADVQASAVQAFLARLRDQGNALPPLDPAKTVWTKREAAEALGVTPSSIPSLVRRHRLPAVGRGKARRFPRETVEALRAQSERGCSAATVNYYLREVRSFTLWLVDDRRTGDNPLAHLSGSIVTTDRRHDRRALPAAELRQILDAALASPVTFRGLDGRDRHHLYLTAMTTGYRAEELANLEPESFALDAEPFTATLPARLTKNKTTATQPLPDDAAAALREYLKGRLAGQPVWPGNWYKRAAEMLRIDLDACGIPYSVEGPDGPLFADFHALRHSFIALMDKSGVSVKEAMQLARHSDPKLTLAVYGKARLHDLSGAVEKLPSLLPAKPFKATGTDG